ncbi:hypothetical protein GCM10027020_19680 [Nocardioides salsibiostraticola]
MASVGSAATSGTDSWAGSVAVGATGSSTVGETVGVVSDPVPPPDVHADNVRAVLSARTPSKCEVDKNEGLSTDPPTVGTAENPR